MKYSYAIQETNENMAFAVGKDLNISTKKAVEICSRIRNKSVAKAKRLLESAIALEKAIPMTRYNRDVGHSKGGLGPARYMVKTATEIMKVIESAEANAVNKGLSTNSLIISHICTHNAARPMHYGRRRRKTKRAHVEVVLLEQRKKDEEKK